MKTKAKARAKAKQGAPETAASMLSVPEYVRAWQLYETIATATEQLAKLARSELSNREQNLSVAGVTWQSSKRYATSFLGALPRMATRKALAVLAQAPAEPCALAHGLAVALTDAVREFGVAVDSYPVQFRNAARQQMEWPLLRAIGSKGGKRDAFSALAAKIGLAGDAEIKRDAAIDWQSLANRETVKCLFAVQSLKEWAESAPVGTVAPWVLKLTATQFPPLTRKRESLAVWFSCGIRPQLEANRSAMLATTLRGYRDALRKAGKTDAAIWARFIKDCWDALERLAPKT